MATVSVLVDPIYKANRARIEFDDFRIVGGNLTGLYPDCVAVGSQRDWCCSGTLVAPRAVLTAAHCVNAGCGQRVFLGEDVSNLAAGRVIAVETAIVHPGYIGEGNLYDDVAILVLTKSVDDVAPCPVATADAFRDPSLVPSVRLVGYGATSESGRAGYGMRRLVDVALASAGVAYGQRADTEFVAGHQGTHRDTCPGDSGGPAYLDTDEGWAIVGVTSRATTASTNRQCGDGGIYTFVPAYADWIAKNTR